MEGQGGGLEKVYDVWFLQVENAHNRQNLVGRISTSLTNLMGLM